MPMKLHVVSEALIYKALEIPVVLNNCDRVNSTTSQAVDMDIGGAWHGGT